jgi:hypothetical protein
LGRNRSIFRKRWRHYISSIERNKIVKTTSQTIQYTVKLLSLVPERWGIRYLPPPSTFKKSKLEAEANIPIPKIEKI